MHNYFDFLIEWMEDDEQAAALSYLIIPDELFN